MKNLNDEKLLSLLKDNSHEAFNEIMNRHYQQALNYGCFICFNREKVKDVLNDIMADIWERRDAIIITGKIISYLKGAVRNNLTETSRRIAIERFNNSADYHAQRNPFVDDSDYLVRTHELNDKISKAISSLPIKMRTVFEMSRYKGLSRHQIAEELKVPDGNVKTNMTRALAILKAKLSQYA